MRHFVCGRFQCLIMDEVNIRYFCGLLVLSWITAAQTPEAVTSSPTSLSVTETTTSPSTLAVTPVSTNMTDESNTTALYGCEVQPCMNQGTCRDQPATESHKFICICPEGFTGTICENKIDLCSRNPCENGVCIASGNSYTCNCTSSGYSGVNCTDDINECYNATPCGTYRCYNYPGEFSCACPAGYDGVPCTEINECSSSPCQNGGNCTDRVNEFTCNCAPGYTGSSCEADINECDSNPCADHPNMRCLDLLNSFRCTCLEGFSGNETCSDIDECDMKVCRNNATCENTLGSYNCSCLPGFTGKNCNVTIRACEPNPCSNNSTCSGGVSNYTCSCLPGYTGRHCETDNDDCLHNQCQNQVVCRDQVNSYKCVCLPGWTGVHCETDIDECQSNPCLNNGQCHNNHNSYNCTCLNGYEGINCGTNIDDCSKTLPCKNDGECFDGISDYSCNCTSNWMGKNCTDPYDACSFNPCFYGANCTTVKPHHNYTCACLPGFTGVNCEIDIDDCAHNNCSSYQKCYDGIESFNCGCPVGFTGVFCEIEVDECEANPCKNNGTCSSGRGNYTCTCPNSYINLTSLLGPKGLFLTGYNGRNCENDIKVCDYSDPPICQSQGKCDNIPAGSFTCYCKSVEGEFYTGTLCEQVRSYCNIRLPEQECQNGGTCVDIPLGYRCNCIDGFTDTHCQTNIDECFSSPCQYNGSCHDLVNDYACTCIEGITGQNCETNINDCYSNPCLHGGDCQDHINSFSCNCSNTGFNGTTCEENIDDCVGNQCKNGGTCVDGVTEYSCDCFPGYNGSRCEVDIPECSPNPCAHNSACLEYSNTSLYDKGNPDFVNFTYANATGYLCICVTGVEGKNCSDDINECLLKPCKHNSSCVNLINNGFICTCSSGYEGSQCENETNECDVYKPCKNGGSCFDKLADYDCICPTPVAAMKNYAGKNCTTYLYGCDGNNNKCRNGNCIPKLIGSEHSNVCVCYPGYTGAICSESTDMSFRGSQNDYIKSQMNTSEFNLSLRFQTTISNTVLLVWEISPNAYVSIELTNGRVTLKYKTSFNFQWCTLTTLSTVNNSQYHHLNLTVAHIVTLSLPLDFCSNSSCHTQNCQTFLNLTGNQLPSVSQVYIGSNGTVKDPSNEIFSKSFSGCMEDVLIDNELCYPGKQIAQYSGVTPGCSRVTQCVKDSCSTHGLCEDLWDKHVCWCYRPFYGDKCQKEYQSATFGINLNSVVIYNDVPIDQNNPQLSFFIVTRQEEGFIVYFGNQQFENDKRLSYVVLYIKNGRLMGDFNKCGYTKHFDTSRQISDGQKHFISLDIKERMFTVMVNLMPAFQDPYVVSDDNCTPGYRFMVTLIHFGQGYITTSPRAKRDVDWSDVNKEGIGISKINHQRWKRQANNSQLVSYQHMPGFQGVIQNVQVKELVLSFNDTGFTTPVISNITIGAFSTKDICNDSQCENGGNCTNIFYNDFNCSCTPGFTGKNCSLLDYCHFGTCPSWSTCQNLQEGYECSSTASFNMDSSIVTYTISGNTPDPVLTFDFRTRGLYGLIFLLRKGNYYFKVRVANGRLEMNRKLTSDFSVTTVTRQRKQVNDGMWYQAKFEVINGINITLQVLQDGVLVDDTEIVNLAVANFSVEDMLRNGEIILGSTDQKKFSIQWEAGYKGCLRDVRMGGQLMPFISHQMLRNNTARNRFLAQRVENIVNDCNGTDACAGHFCLNGGVCVDLWNSYKCECPFGLEGLLCEDNPDNCASQPCHNGGLCVDGLGTFTCTCPKRFSGPLCEEVKDPCNANNSALCDNNSICTDLGTDFRCNCTNPEYTGWYCNVSINLSCSTGLCQNGGECRNITINAETNVSSFNCTCKPGYEGPLCEKEIDYCSINGPMCANNGQCINSPDNQSYTCHCNESLDYTGFNCSEKINNCSVNSCPGGLCIDGVKNFTCFCHEGFTGHNCGTDDCQSMSPCQRGNCTGDICNCTGSGWTGPGCREDFNECNSKESVCLHSGKCTNFEGNYTCNCTLGYEGLNCQTPNCSNSFCNIGYGSCNNNFTDWWCECKPYVEGLFCEEIGLCYYEPCDHGSCTQNTTLNNYTCSCVEGWQGINCTDDINECERKTDKCLNGSTCININGSYTCSCQPGYTGRFCNMDIKECDSSPCEHGGTCEDLINNYTCKCANGYEGNTCSTDINECESNSTICNLGICINLNGSYTCNCTDKYMGKNCEFNNPCYNKTKCLNGVDCKYNQTGNGVCSCAEGYEGADCEKKQSGSSGPDLGVIIGPIVGGVVLIILVIVIIAFVMTARSKRATRGAYSPSQQETSGSRVEMGNVLKKPPEERLI